VGAISIFGYAGFAAGTITCALSFLRGGHLPFASFIFSITVGPYSDKQPKTRNFGSYDPANLEKEKDAPASFSFSFQKNKFEGILKDGNP
jgi:hypothetical protein